MKRLIIALLLFAIPTLSSAQEQPDLESGVGWTMTNLDLEVRIENDDPSMTVEGTMTVRLDIDRSSGPSFALNLSSTAMRWVTLDGPKNSQVQLNEELPGAEAALMANVRLDKAASRGDELEFRFALELTAPASQLMARTDIALSSWVEAWYPVAITSLDYEQTFTAKMSTVPGTTTLDLPGEWIALSDGELTKREHSNGRTIEVWDLRGKPVARGFAAAQYTAAEREVDGRTIRIYLLNEHVMGVDQLVGLIAESMAAQEARLGPFPFAGYGVAEVPNDIKGWSAASQQTFIMSKSANFDPEHGNLPLWAHEMCHGWWGNTVGTRGPGAKVAGESLAQFGVLISVEALEGVDAMVEFLEFSRSGYSRRQCARGYFSLIDQGQDHALATMGNSDLHGGATHMLADSKGMWMYHMLRRRIGDDTFFATLRGLIDEYGGRDMSLDDIRQAFVEAAPDQELEQFFAQWLDRTGAPRIDVAWSTPEAGRVEILLTQQPDVDPFELDLVIEIEFEDGSKKRERVGVSGMDSGLSVATPSSISAITLDPDRDLLIWRPAYDAPPSVDGVALVAMAPWVDVSVYKGSYFVEALQETARVYGGDEGLWVQAGDYLLQLFPIEHHRFKSDMGVVEFQIENGEATGFIVELDSGGNAEGVRVEDEGAE